MDEKKYEMPAAFREIQAVLLKGGAASPVALILPAASPEARAVSQAAARIKGAPAGGVDSDQVLSCDVDTAVSLLRSHGGAAGVAVAKNLAAAIRMDCWMVLLADGGVMALGYRDGAETIRLVARHDPSALEPPPEFVDLLNDEGPSLLRVEGPDGTAAPVGGPDGVSAMLSLTLVGIATSRRLTSCRHGCKVEVAVDDHFFATFLRDVHGDQPQVVAEALRALRQMNSPGEQWLTSILWGRPDLRPLAEAVQRELTGEG